MAARFPRAINLFLAFTMARTYGHGRRWELYKSRVMLLTGVLLLWNPAVTQNAPSLLERLQRLPVHPTVDRGGTVGLRPAGQYQGAAVVKDGAILWGITRLLVLVHLRGTIIFDK
jgi:hypothetical protein